MGLQGFEQRLERLVEGVFAKAFRSGLKPVEVGRRLTREMDLHRTLGVNGPLSPNHFTVALSAADSEQFDSFSEVLTRELAEAVRDHARSEGYGFVGPVHVELHIDESLTTGQFHWVLALASFGISAADAYRELDRQRAADDAPAAAGAPELLLDALRAGDPHRVGAALSNDLQPAALVLTPALRRTLAAGIELGAIAGLVCGSGPTCAFLCADARAANRLAESLAAEGVCRTTRVARGPVPGARVVL